jgi:hypothetical protein
MGRIEEKHRKRKEQDQPLDSFGNRKRENNEVDFDEKTIKDQKNKK